MDIDAFSQCLTYASTLKNGTTLEKSLPIITTISGIVVGFILSTVREGRKDTKASKNKKSCILDDTKRVKVDILSVFKQSLQMIDAYNSGATIARHNLPPTINLVFIDEYFTSIAHLYSPEERTAIIELNIITKNLNNYLIHFRGENDLASTPGYENILHNTLNHSIFCAALCDSIMTGEKPEYNKLIKIADELCIKSAHVEYFRKRQEQTT